MDPIPLDVETGAPAGNKKVLIAGVIGFVVGFGVSYLWLSGSVTPAGDDTVRNGDDSEVTRDDVDSSGDTEDVGDGTMVNGDSTINVDLGREVLPDELPGVTETPVDISSNAILVTDQGAGSSVVIDQVFLGERAWVVIYEDDRGRPGAILGARRLPAGVHQDERVRLLRETIPGGVYHAMIHRDDGDDTFDFTKDLPWIDTTGTRITAVFNTVGAN